MDMSKSPEEYFAKVPQWIPILQSLRNLLNTTELTEKIKWGMPVYTFDNKNIVGIGAFKDYAGIWFYQGVFLKDKLGVLLNAQEGKTKAMRQWRFRSPEELNEEQLLLYIEEAIANQKAGLEIKPDTKKAVIIPDELQSALDTDIELMTQFKGFTKGRKREFADYIRDAKRESTRLNRLEKIKPLIKTGIGLNDKYRKK